MKKLVVATNPHKHVDHLGRPCAVCPIDPRDPRFFDPAKDRNAEVRGWVGADLAPSPKLLRKGGGKGAGPADPSERHDVQFRFRFAPFEIPDTKFYRDRLAEGAIVVADEATAKATGRVFVTVAQVRSMSRRGNTNDPLWIDPPLEDDGNDQEAEAEDPAEEEKPDESSDESDAAGVVENTEASVYSHGSGRRRGKNKPFGLS